MFSSSNFTVSFLHLFHLFRIYFGIRNVLGLQIYYFYFIILQIVNSCLNTTHLKIHLLLNIANY